MEISLTKPLRPVGGAITVWKLITSSTQINHRLHDMIIMKQFSSTYYFMFTFGYEQFQHHH